MMKKKGMLKYVSIILVFTLICTTVLSVMQENKTYGKNIYEAPEQYIADEVAETMQIVVTQQRDDKNYEMGTGAETIKKDINGNDVDIPSVIGEKGTKDNPFVILEIVPDKSEQQMPYYAGLNNVLGLENSIKLSSGLSGQTSRSWKDTDAGQLNNLLNEVDSTALGNWLHTESYKVFDFWNEQEQEEPERTEMKLARKDSYYTLEFTGDDIEAAGYDVEQFDKDYNNGSASMKDMASKYPLLFSKDSSKEQLEIYQVALDDEKNWEKSGGLKTTPAEQKTVTEGYFVVTKCGEGYFLFEPSKGWLTNDFESWWMQDYNFKWVYSEEIPEGGTPILSSMDNYWNINNLITYADNDDYVNYYYEIPEGTSYTVAMGKATTQYEYKFVYWGIKFNDILKRSLFTFNNQKDCDNFHLEVITMTPAEINDICRQGDLDDEEGKETLDIVERADLFYLSSSLEFKNGNLVEVDTNPKTLYTLYNRYIKGIEADGWTPNMSYSYSIDKTSSFLVNDLEWNVCMKIIQRLHNDTQLPLMTNQGVGTIFGAGASLKGQNEVCMFLGDYYSGGNQESNIVSKNSHKLGAVNNIAKLFLIISQFDLQADTTRTFMTHIFPQIQQVKLSEEFVGKMVDGSATTTGYYVRSANEAKNGCASSDKDCQVLKGEHLGEGYEDIQERERYLWNACTFYPSDMGVDYTQNEWGSVGAQLGINKEEAIKKFLDQGYLKKYLYTEDANTQFPFCDGKDLDMLMYASGVANGEDLDGRNVTIMNGGGGTNLSSLIDPTGAKQGMTSDYFNILYQILNSNPRARDLELVVLPHKKQYVKLTDTSVLLDYNKDAKYSNAENKQLYLKVSISNSGNNLPGVVSSIKLVKENGDTKKADGLYKTNNFVDENLVEIKSFDDINGVVSGYVIDGSQIVFYVPYTLKEWQDGYNCIRFEMYGRRGIIKSGVPTSTKHTAAPSIVNVTIDERLLFNLE